VEKEESHLGGFAAFWTQCGARRPRSCGSPARFHWHRGHPAPLGFAMRTGRPSFFVFISAFNRTRKATGKGNSACGTEISGYSDTMNSLGQRARTQHTGTAFGTPACRHRFLSNGWNVQTKYNLANGTPTLTAVNTWGLDLSNSRQRAGGVGGLLTRASGETTHSYTYDGNGNVSELVTSAGTVAGHYEYGPFGQTTFQTVGNIEANANPITMALIMRNRRYQFGSTILLVRIVLRLLEVGGMKKKVI